MSDRRRVRLAGEADEARLAARRRVLVTALAVATLILLLGAPRLAWAHNGLVDSSPGDGEAVARPPNTVILTFNEPAVSTGTKVLVTGPGGSATRGDPRLVDNTVRQDLMAALPAGEYTVDWRVTSADGHPINGSFSFTVRTVTVTPTATESASPTGAPASTPGTPTASSSPVPTAVNTFPTESDDGTGAPPRWPWLIAIIPIGLAAVLGWRFSRR